jgi:hypothetical protein
MAGTFIRFSFSAATERLQLTQPALSGRHRARSNGRTLMPEAPVPGATLVVREECSEGLPLKRKFALASCVSLCLPTKITRNLCPETQI